MPSSPRTPTRRRQSSIKSIDLSFSLPSPQSNGRSSRNHSFSRRSSQYSIHTPTTPRPPSSNDRNRNFFEHNGFSEFGESGKGEEKGNGLGNLADELAEAWDEDAEAEDMSHSHFDGQRESGNALINGYTTGVQQELGIVKCPSPTIDNASNMSLSPPKILYRSKHQRQNSQYDGSDYGDDSNLENPDGIPSSLEARIAAIESLARRGKEANGSEADNVVQRVADSLKDLPSQSGVENGTSR